MAEDAPAPVMATAPDHDFAAHTHQPMHTTPNPAMNTSRKSTLDVLSEFELQGPGTQTPITGMGARHSLDLDDYFVGPRDMDRHSKLPYFMRMHGSVLPRMILPLTMIGGWATLITCVSKFVDGVQLEVDTLLLTVLGFVVGLALSFRSTTAYERYSDGRKTWTTLSVQARNLARYIWVHVDERPGELGKDDLLAKVTAINLILAFAVSLKHKLRFEPYAHYDDLRDLVSHLDTFAKAAYTPDVEIKKKKSLWKSIGEYLGLSFANSNPRKALKRASKPVGNLPLEILVYLSSYIKEVDTNKTLSSPVVLGQILTSLASLTDTQASAERVLATPLPIGYNILISQIVLLYVYLLPFQLLGKLGWITIPGCIAAAYIIIGLAAIGNELENPFGNDVNDLPLDQYCAELGKELDIMTSAPAGNWSDVMSDAAGECKPLWPLSTSGHAVWRERGVGDIRGALRAKVVVGKNTSVSASASGQPGSKPHSSSGTTTTLEA